MQMNVVLDRNQALNRARHFDLIYPVFWFEAGIDSLPENLAGKLRMAQDLPSLAKNIVMVLCGLLTIVFFIVLIARVILSWRSSDHSSFRSLDSTQVTRSTTPDCDGSHFNRADRDAYAPEIGEVEGLLNDGTYRSFERPHSGVTNDIPVLITDYHTLLPPYKIAKEESQASDQFSDVGNSFGRDFLDSAGEQISETKPSTVDHNHHEIYEASNEYPPCYEVASLPGVFLSSPESSSSSVSVSADVHHSDSYVDVRRLGNSSPFLTSEYEITPTNYQSPIELPIENTAPLGGQDVYHEIDHNLVIVCAAPKIVSETIKQREDLPPLKITPPGSAEELNLIETPSAYGAVEDCTNNEAPLATSSPHETADDIQPSHITREDPGQAPVEPGASSARPPSLNKIRDSCANHELLHKRDSRSRASSRSIGESPGTLALLESDL